VGKTSLVIGNCTFRFCRNKEEVFDVVEGKQ